MLDTRLPGLMPQLQDEKNILHGRLSSLTAKVGILSAPNKRNRMGAIVKHMDTTVAKVAENLSDTASVLVNKHSCRAIGVIVPDITTTFFANVIAGVEELAGHEKYMTIICQSGEQLEKEKAAVQTLIDQHVSCIIISLSAETAATHDTEHLKNAIDHQIKVIQFDRTDDTLGTDRVVNEVDTVMASIIHHFLAQGYRNIACLAGPQHIDIFKKRKEAFEKFIQKMDLPAIKDNIAYYDLTRESAKNAAAKLLSKKNRPDAIVTATDLGALGVWDVANETGLEMPKDLGLCGFSNEYYTELVSPNITSADQQSVEMGKAAARLFFESLQKKKNANQEPRTIVLHPQLIVRASSDRIQ